MSSEKLTKDDQSLAILGITLQNNIDSVPSLLEVDLWRRGKLEDEKRAAKVKTFVAKTPLGASMLEELLINEKILEKLTQEENQTIKKIKPEISVHKKLYKWFASSQPLPVFGSTVAVCSILVLCMHFLTATSLNELVDDSYQTGFDSEITFEDWPWSEILITKSIDGWKDPVSNQITTDQLAFQYGIRQGLVELINQNNLWREYINTLPAKLPQCIEKEGCVEKQELLRLLGKFSVLNFYQCIDEDIDNLNRAGQNKIYKEFLRRLSSYELQVEYISTLSNLDDKNEMEFCTNVERLISVGMK